jgi:hypothetical protein
MIMNVEDFVNKMNNIRLEFSDLDNATYSKEFLKKTIEGFTFYRKQKQYTLTNPLERLISEFDCSKVEIGFITFDDEVTEDSNFSYVGKHEADELAINKTTEEVELREFGRNHTLCVCAKNSSLFLEAILVFAQYASKFPFEEDKNSCQIALECSQIAGGEKYLTYFQLLMGCEN